MKKNNSKTFTEIKTKTNESNSQNQIQLSDLIDICNSPYTKNKTELNISKKCKQLKSKFENHFKEIENVCKELIQISKSSKNNFNHLSNYGKDILSYYKQLLKKLEESAYYTDGIQTNIQSNKIIVKSNRLSTPFHCYLQFLDENALNGYFEHLYRFCINPENYNKRISKLDSSSIRTNVSINKSRYQVRAFIPRGSSNSSSQALFTLLCIARKIRFKDKSLSANSLPGSISISNLGKILSDKHTDSKVLVKTKLTRCRIDVSNAVEEALNINLKQHEMFEIPSNNLQYCYLNLDPDAIHFLPTHIENKIMKYNKAF